LFSYKIIKTKLLNRGKKILKWPVTAIILAGGKSRRMRRTKSLLSIDGKPLIEHILYQIRPHFEQILISSNDIERYCFLDADVIPDEIPGYGPLMGILSSLKKSLNDINFVLACDIPIINIDYVYSMIEASIGYDGVIPVKEETKYEPLFGIYKKSMIGGICRVLNSGKRKISEAYRYCNIKYMDFSNEDWYKNLNTLEEYKKYIGVK